MGEYVPLESNIRVLVREWIIETPDGQENLVDHHCTVSFMDVREYDLEEDRLYVLAHDAIHVIPMSNILHIQIQPTWNSEEG